MTLDHLIATVPDLRGTHEKLMGMGFAEAWPPGPFWPQATTSGIALGGANLELIQPDAGVVRPRIDTLVFAPASLEEGRRYLDRLGLGYEERIKIEPNPALLALRGFPPSMTDRPQEICTNLYPDHPPFPFFLCVYSPFLKDRLAPARFPKPHQALEGFVAASPRPDWVIDAFQEPLNGLRLRSVHGKDSEVRAIWLRDGLTITPDLLLDRPVSGFQDP